MWIRLSLLVGCLVALGPLFAAAADPTLQIVSFGVSHTANERIIPDASLLSGQRREGDVVAANATDQVRLLADVRFGVAVQATSSAAGGPAPMFREIIRFPAPLTNPTTHQTKAFDELPLTLRPGETRILYYGFDHDWELAPGTWTFEFWDRDTKLAEKAFVVAGP